MNIFGKYKTQSEQERCEEILDESMRRFKTELKKKKPSMSFRDIPEVRGSFYFEEGKFIFSFGGPSFEIEFSSNDIATFKITKHDFFVEVSEK